MNFELFFKHVITSFEESEIRYAFVGGFALGIMGILRSTMDLDFLLFTDDLDKADNILTQNMYTCVHRSENISQYSSEIRELGHVDFIHAFRPLSKNMLNRASRFTVFEKYSVPVLTPEDIIGLKIQAIANDPTRETEDYQDMRLLLEYKKQNDMTIDWELLSDYFNLFKQESLLNQLKNEFI